MMQEAAWKKSGKVLKIAYLGKDGRSIDEKRFRSLYLEFIQKHNNTFDDECVPQDQGVYTDLVVTLLDFVNPKCPSSAQTCHLYRAWHWAWAHIHR